MIIKTGICVSKRFEFAESRSKQVRERDRKRPKGTEKDQCKLKSNIIDVGKWTCIALIVKKWTLTKTEKKKL